MNKKDLKKFASIMVAMAENFSAQLSNAGIVMRFEAMIDLTIEEIEQAAKEILRSRKFLKMPTVAEFIEHVRGDPESKALVQASRVLEAIKRHGANASVAFDDPITQAVIRYGFGGWIKTCGELLSENEKWFIRDFCRIYQGYSKEGVKVFGHLPGIIESVNSANGHPDHIPDPVLIGDRAEAKRIADTVQSGGILESGKVVRLIDRVGG
jgi:hypothetical protein